MCTQYSGYICVYCNLWTGLMMKSFAIKNVGVNGMNQYHLNAMLSLMLWTMVWQSCLSTPLYPWYVHPVDCTNNISIETIIDGNTNEKNPPVAGGSPRLSHQYLFFSVFLKNNCCCGDYTKSWETTVCVIFCGVCDSGPLNQASILDSPSPFQDLV